MKKIVMAVFLLVFASALISCGGKQVKTGSTDGLVGPLNKQLQRATFSGFGYKSTKPPAQKWDKWAASAAPLVRKVLKKVPEGYVLQVTGHTDASGPEEPEGNKPGNIKISDGRAKAVYNSLRRQGLKSSKLTYKGVGSSEVDSNYDDRSSRQRRVTFIVIEK
jgi:outer membrane protein OmpA-like peptidoglycan-associated protein